MRAALQLAGAAAAAAGTAAWPWCRPHLPAAPAVHVRLLSVRYELLHRRKARAALLAQLRPGAAAPAATAPLLLWRPGCRRGPRQVYHIPRLRRCRPCCCTAARCCPRCPRLRRCRPRCCPAACPLLRRRPILLQLVLHAGSTPAAAAFLGCACCCCRRWLLGSCLPAGGARGEEPPEGLRQRPKAALRCCGSGRLPAGALVVAR